MRLFRIGILIAVSLLMCSCASVQKKVKQWGGGDKAKQKKEKPAVLRPTDAKGLVPSSDRAAHAAQQLHRQRFPEESGKRVISMVKGDVAVVKIYMDDKKELISSKKTKSTAPPEQYWVGRKADGRWYAYHELPLKEDFKFVFEEMSKEYLSKKHSGTAQVHDFNLLASESEGTEREVRLRYSVSGEIFVKRLSFQKNPENGWAISKDEPIKSVY